MKSNFLFFLFIVGICVLLAFTNPSAQQHQRVILNEVSINTGNDVAGEYGGFFGQVVGNFIGEGLEDLNISLFNYNNYYLFSTMTTRGETISIGILGQVIVIN